MAASTTASFYQQSRTYFPIAISKGFQVPQSVTHAKLCAIIYPSAGKKKGKIVRRKSRIAFQIISKKLSSSSPSL